MSHDLLAQMSAAAREEALADPRWEDFARGALPDAERDDLLAKARDAGVTEETLRALGPRDETHDDRLANAALAALQAPARPAAASRPAAPEPAASHATSPTTNIPALRRLNLFCRLLCEHALSAQPKP